MPRMNRSLSMPLDEIGVYHCYSRCVQQAYLCGYDPDKKIDFSYRKAWIREKLRRLAKAFAIDIWKYALMSTHIHVILRNRPDVSRHWTDQEIARRWWEVCPGRIVDGLPAEPKQVELNLWLNDPEFMLELRSRIADPSWLMRELLVNIARKANKETNKEGKFWDHRFGSRRLLDEAAILACALYVDLNVVRADQAQSLDASEFTSIYDQIRGRKQRLARAQDHNLLVPPDGGLLLDTALIAPDDADAWLSASTLDPQRRIETLDNHWIDEFGEIVWEEFTWSDDESSSEPGATICPLLEMNFTPQDLADLGLPTDISELATTAIANLRDASQSADEATTSSEVERGRAAATSNESDESQAASVWDHKDCSERDKSCLVTRKRCSTEGSDSPDAVTKPRRQNDSWWNDPSVPRTDKRPQPRRASPTRDTREAEETLLSKKRVIRLSEATCFPASRASNKGFTSLTFDEYLELAEWVGRQVRRDKRGVIEKSSPVGPNNVGARHRIATQRKSTSSENASKSISTNNGDSTTQVRVRVQESPEHGTDNRRPPGEPPCETPLNGSDTRAASTLSKRYCSPLNGLGEPSEIADAERDDLTLVAVSSSRIEPSSQVDEDEEKPPETLQRVGIDGHGLLDLISKMGDHFGIAIGRLENVLAEAKRVGRNWLWRQKLMARVFT